MRKKHRKRRNNKCFKIIKKYNYQRVSTDEQGFNQQDEHLQQFCNKESMNIQDISIQREKINGTAEIKPILKALLLEMYQERKKGFQVWLILSDLDRLGRKSKQLKEITRELISKDIKLIVIDDTMQYNDRPILIDTRKNQNMEQLQADIDRLADQSENFIKNQAKKSKRGIDRAKEEDRLAGKPSRFGRKKITKAKLLKAEEYKEFIKVMKSKLYSTYTIEDKFSKINELRTKNGKQKKCRTTLYKWLNLYK